MAKFLKSKLIVGAACVLLAAMISFVLLPRMYASKSQTTSVIKLAEDIPAGTTITDGMLTAATVGSYGLPGSVVTDALEAVGKVASENLYAGDYLTRNRLITAQEHDVLVESQTKGLENGYCLVTLQLSTASSGVASVLRSGHIVDAHECVVNEDKSITVQKVISNLYVYDVLNGDLESLRELDIAYEEALVKEDTDYDFEPAFVVFRCTEQQAQTLIRLERMEALHLTLQRTGG